MAGFVNNINNTSSIQGIDANPQRNISNGQLPQGQQVEVADNSQERARISSAASYLAFVNSYDEDISEFIQNDTVENDLDNAVAPRSWSLSLQRVTDHL